MSSVPASQLYTDINFIPGWYVQAKRQDLSLRRQVVMIVVMAVLLGWLIYRAVDTRAETRLYLNTLLERLESTERQIDEVTKLEAAQEELTKQLAVHRRLHQPINYSQISGTLARLLPEAVSLRGLEMETVKHEIKDNAPKTGNRRRSSKSKSSAPSRFRMMVQITLEGVAPNDVHIANFIGKLASSQLFSNVKMDYTRQGRTKELITREFKVHMQVPLDRVYKPLIEGEVADAEK